MRPTKQIFSIISDITTPILKKQGIYVIKLIEDWDIIMPKQISSQSSPIKIIWNKNNQGTLYIKTQNHIAEKIIMHEKDGIIIKINSYFGYQCITKIKFNH